MLKMKTLKTSMAQSVQILKCPQVPRDLMPLLGTLIKREHVDESVPVNRMICNETEPRLTEF